MLRVTTANVNGLRAAARKGFLPWLEATAADVVCLQEVRAEPGQLPAELRDPDGWHAYHAPAETKGRAGVSVLTRRAPTAVRVGFGAAKGALLGVVAKICFGCVIFLIVAWQAFPWHGKTQRIVAPTTLPATP